MANTYESGSAVRSGYYFNAARWHVEPIANDGDKLPDAPGRWMKVPTVVALMLVPILGATFLMFLPLIGFVMLFRALAASFVRVFTASATDLAATMSPGWQPGEAHFTGKSPEHAGVEEKGPTPHGDALDALAAEIQAKRSHG
ncbi:MAG TPA: hypothetical protein VF841_10815 [Anaeromyxobacter sp.]